MWPILWPQIRKGAHGGDGGGKRGARGGGGRGRGCLVNLFHVWSAGPHNINISKQLSGRSNCFFYINNCGLLKGQKEAIHRCSAEYIGHYLHLHILGESYCVQYIQNMKKNNFDNTPLLVTNT